MKQDQDLELPEKVSESPHSFHEAILIGHDVEYELGISELDSGKCGNFYLRSSLEMDRHNSAVLRGSYRELHLKRIPDRPGWWKIVSSIPELDLSPGTLISYGPSKCTNLEISKIVLPYLQAKIADLEKEVAELSARIMNGIEKLGGGSPELQTLRDTRQEKSLEGGAYNTMISVWMARLPSSK